MIYIFLALVMGLSIYDMRHMKKKGQTKDMYFYAGFMLLVAVFGVIYLSDTFRPSIISYFLRLFNVKE